MAGKRATNLFGPSRRDTISPQLIAQGGRSIGAGIAALAGGVSSGIERGRERDDRKEENEARRADAKAARAESIQLLIAAGNRAVHDIATDQFDPK